MDQAFLDELDDAYQSTMLPRDLGPSALEDLEASLAAIRASALARVEVLRQELGRDDPAFGQISLLSSLGLGQREVAHTQTLSWLLEPDNPHGLEQAPMAALLDELGVLPPGASLRVDRVHAEHSVPISKSGTLGRLDIYAQGRFEGDETPATDWQLAVEAKVGASERDSQLSDYEGWLLQQERQTIGVYLTPHGSNPKTGRAIKWEVLSFERLAAVLWRACRGLPDGDGKTFLRFYLTGVLRDVCKANLRSARGASDGSAALVDNPYAALRYLERALGRAVRAP